MQTIRNAAGNIVGYIEQGAGCGCSWPVLGGMLIVACVVLEKIVDILNALPEPVSWIVFAFVFLSVLVLVIYKIREAFEEDNRFLVAVYGVALISMLGVAYLIFHFLVLAH